MKLIAGLGNPGEKYKNTRHNIGFMVVDALAREHGANWQFNKKFNSEIAEIKNYKEPLMSSKTSKVLLIKPQTFMNNSGQAVRAILDFYKLLPKTLGMLVKKDSDLTDALTIIHDDIDFNLGEFKIQKNRSSGGHKGVQSIIQHLKTQNFTRVRIGIRPKPEKMPTEKFVLQKFSKEERAELERIIPKIIVGIIKDNNVHFPTYRKRDKARCK